MMTLRPELLQCRGADCNRWVFTHGRTPLGTVTEDGIMCSEHYRLCGTPGCLKPAGHEGPCG